jgi:hypothetical protein
MIEVAASTRMASSKGGIAKPPQGNESQVIYENGNYVRYNSLRGKDN